MLQAIRSRPGQRILLGTSLTDTSFETDPRHEQGATDGTAQSLSDDSTVTELSDSGTDSITDEGDVDTATAYGVTIAEAILRPHAMLRPFRIPTASS